MREYTVRPGDTLARIASYYGVSEEYILAANPSLKQQPLPPGIKLIIPFTREIEEYLKPLGPLR